MRPEGLGGRIEVQRSRQPGRYDGIIHPEILGAEVLERSRARFGSYLLPQAFPEGSPTSPDYTAGHAVVAGACATVLKAYFNEDLPLPAPVVPDAEGTGLVPWTGGELTVGGELNKLAANLSYGRDLGGVHYRSAIREGLPLGEQVAIALLRDQKPTTLEDANLRLTRFDGTTITI